MGGCFDNSNPLEYNVVKDIPAAQKVFAEWPTRLVTSPFEVGIKINYPASSIEKDFNGQPYIRWWRLTKVIKNALRPSNMGFNIRIICS